jgi:hypothetical protein
MSNKICELFGNSRIWNQIPDAASEFRLVSPHHSALAARDEIPGLALGRSHGESGRPVVSPDAATNEHDR